MLEHVSSFVLTYALHSSVLLGLGLLVAATVRREGWSETVLRSALLASIIAPLLVFADPVSMTGNRPAAGGEAEPRAHGTMAPAVGAAVAEASADAVREVEGKARGGWTVRVPSRRWLVVAVAVWVAGATCGIVLLVVAHARFRRRIAVRQAVNDTDLEDMLRACTGALGFRRPVRLSWVDDGSVPFAIGRSEICLPGWFATRLAPDEQRAALAHEVAHLRRFDPWWQFGLAMVTAVFFFQPLNRIYRLRLRATAERLCDEAAVSCTRDPLALLRCLTKVAERQSQGSSAFTAALAQRRSAFASRVQRLATWREQKQPTGCRRRLVTLVVIAMTIAIASAVQIEASYAESNGGDGASGAPGADLPLTLVAAGRVGSGVMPDDLRCTDVWRAAAANRADEVRQVARGMARQLPGSPLMFLNEHLTTPEQFQAWRRRSLTERDALTTRVEILSPPRAATIADAHDLPVVCVFLKAGVEPHALLGNVR